MGSQAQYLHTLLAMNQTNKVESQTHAERLRFAEMALEALRNVIKNNPGETSHFLQLCSPSGKVFDFNMLFFLERLF